MDSNQESPAGSPLISRVSSTSTALEDKAYFNYLLVELQKNLKKMVDVFKAQMDSLKSQHAEEIRSKDEEIVQLKDLVASIQKELDAANQTIKEKDA